MNEVESLLRQIVTVRERMCERNDKLFAATNGAAPSGEAIDVGELALLNAKLELAKYMEKTQ